MSEPNEERIKAHIERIRALRTGTKELQRAGLISAFEITPVFDEQAVIELGLLTYVMRVCPQIDEP